MSPNDFQTFAIHNTNPNESENNPFLPQSVAIGINPKSIRTTLSPFQFVALIRMNPNPIRTHLHNLQESGETQNSDRNP